MKKMIALLLALVMVFTMAACGSKTEEPANSDENSNTNAPAENTGDADKPADASGETATLTMATSADFPPYEFYENEQIVGIDAEIAAAIAEELGMELKIEDMDFDSIVPSIQSGKADIGMAGLTVTEDRKVAVDFSDSYATGIQVIIVPEDSPITSYDDLANNIGTYKIGVQLATTGDIYATDTPENGGFGMENVEEYTKGPDAILALTSGKIDAVIIDNEPAKAFVEANPGLKILDTEYVVEDYAIATSKDNPELTEQINTALKKLVEDGTVQSILDKYITAE